MGDFYGTGIEIWAGFYWRHLTVGFLYNGFASAEEKTATSKVGLSKYSTDNDDELSCFIVRVVYNRTLGL